MSKSTNEQVPLNHVACPQCGKEVDDRVPACPKCGEKIYVEHPGGITPIRHEPLSANSHDKQAAKD
ncbi:zinc ribbon domain-containing protein [Rhodopirellula halodulae]|uniref:zinc ribbon domain-containing protein n=1 Tax=Rhodopirellula halodulae TaxID=2894198 RepID=UPI001E5F37E9|nr:zinc ribbon domain-containing protein [Rhodopirellula sp. JC737]MCC9658372.1 zinc-ribbon domain-containing protein [Rhodopirellula sp. JC737]